jgi:hypothetical protein
VVRNNGSIEGVEVFQSPGHQSLTTATVELLHLGRTISFPSIIGEISTDSQNHHEGSA